MGWKYLSHSQTSTAAIAVMEATLVSQRWVNHNEVIKWKHFPRYWPFVRGIHRSPVNSPHKGQWRGALTFSWICAWINGWVNNRKAGDSRRHRPHYNVIVIIISTLTNHCDANCAIMYWYGLTLVPEYIGNPGLLVQGYDYYVWRPLLLTRINLIPAWISNHMSCKVWY